MVAPRFFYLMGAFFFSDAGGGVVQPEGGLGAIRGVSLVPEGGRCRGHFSERGLSQACRESSSIIAFVRASLSLCVCMFVCLSLGVCVCVWTSRYFPEVSGMLEERSQIEPRVSRQ